jgi:hypothetical protein
VPCCPKAKSSHPLRIEGALQVAAIGRVCRVTPHDLFADYRGPLFELPIPIADEVIEGHPIACASSAKPAPFARLGTRLRALYYLLFAIHTHRTNHLADAVECLRESGERTREGQR